MMTDLSGLRKIAGKNGILTRFEAMAFLGQFDRVRAAGKTISYQHAGDGFLNSRRWNWGKPSDFRKWDARQLKDLGELEAASRAAKYDLARFVGKGNPWADNQMELIADGMVRVARANGFGPKRK